MSSLSDISIISWLAELDIRTETGEPLDFRNHLFLYDIIRDFSPKQVNLKAAQVGGTLINILKAIYLCDRRKMDCIYTLPTDADVNVMGGGKVNRILANSPKLLELIKDKDTVQQKLIGRNMLYFRGTFNERAAIMVPADCLIHDEEDRSNQSVLSVYSSRLQHSKHKYEWHFSNPSFAGHGVDKYWQKSDQKHWFITCPSCKMEQYLSWPDSVDGTRREFVCKSCHSVLSSEDRRKGRWVKKFKDKEYSGYWVSGLMAPWLSADYILDQFETKPVDYFYNFVLGLPYVGDDNTITPDLIFRNCTEELNSQENVIIGVDVGKTIHYVLGNDEGLFYASNTQEPEDIERLLKRYPGSVAVIDRGPDIFWPQKMREKYPGRVFLCSFARVKKSDRIIRWGENEDYGKVLADRNRLIQLVVDEFSDRRIPLQGTTDDWSEFYSHWKGMFRKQETDALGNPVYVWEKADGNDHYCLAACYYRIGMDKFGSLKSEIVEAESPLKVQSGYEVSPGQTVPAKAVFQMPDTSEDLWQ